MLIHEHTWRVVLNQQQNKAELIINYLHWLPFCGIEILKVDLAFVWLSIHTWKSKVPTFLLQAQKSI